jgi:hypothetical protein
MPAWHNLRTLHQLLKSVFSLFIILKEERNPCLKRLKRNFQCAPKTVSSFYSPSLFAITRRGRVLWENPQDIVRWHDILFLKMFNCGKQFKNRSLWHPLVAEKSWELCPHEHLLASDRKPVIFIIFFKWSSLYFLYNIESVSRPGAGRCGRYLES